MGDNLRQSMVRSVARSMDNQKAAQRRRLIQRGKLKPRYDGESASNNSACRLARDMFFQMRPDLRETFDAPLSDSRTARSERANLWFTAEEESPQTQLEAERVQQQQREHQTPGKAPLFSERDAMHPNFRKHPAVQRAGAFSRWAAGLPVTESDGQSPEEEARWKRIDRNEAERKLKAGRAWGRTLSKVRHNAPVQ
eukprot:Hpha_TRINITY_DN34702_c0_g1::TRINITY_DN34702_c0_g1_i1::g.178050::m.178050